MILQCLWLLEESLTDLQGKVGKGSIEDVDVSKRVSEKHLLLLHDFAEAFDHADHNKLENS